MNISLAKKIIETCTAQGAHDFVICAGARNSPLVMLLEKAQGIEIFSFFDERAAGFFALGRSRRDRRPVVVVTTSGTAVAELLPSAVEATYTQTPLIFVTADRPRSYRGTGAPQAIEQVGIFSHYVQASVDIASLDENLDFTNWSRQAPIQINVSFAEPLIDEEVPTLHLSVGEATPTIPQLQPVKFLKVDQPLVIVGPLEKWQTGSVTRWLLENKLPIYAECLSNLRNVSELEPYLIQGGEKSVQKAFEKSHFQSVIRVGGVPTLRFWRDLEESYSKVPVYSCSDGEYKGLSRQVRHFYGLEHLALFQIHSDASKISQFLSEDRLLAKSLMAILEKYPQSEPSLLHRLSKKMDGLVYVGNSLPIRELDLVMPTQNPAQHVAGNRGANGIDGQISTFLGMSSEQSANWCVVGDLTALYDLSSLWVTNQLSQRPLRIVVVNNQGGMIFKNMFKKDLFLNSHHLKFKAWAEMWGWHYNQSGDIPSGELAFADLQILELTPNPESTNSFWQEYQKL